MVITGKISIVIPCYNQGVFLRETLASVKRIADETLLEVIIVDDGSTEPDTCKLFEELVNSDYKIIRQRNKGLGAARNAGIQLAKAEFILPLDSDNLIRETYLTHGIELMLENPNVGIVYGNAEYFGEKTGPWLVPEFSLLEMAKGNFIDACALYRKTVWESIQGYDEHMPWMGWEDWDFWLRAAINGWGFYHLDQIAFDYRVRSGSMINGTNRHNVELLTYIFSKPQNRVTSLLREQSFEMERLRLEGEQFRYKAEQLQTSFDYRIGSAMLAPLRRLKQIMRHG